MIFVCFSNDRKDVNSVAKIDIFHEFTLKIEWELLKNDAAPFCKHLII